MAKTEKLRSLKATLVETQTAFKVLAEKFANRDRAGYRGRPYLDLLSKLDELKKETTAMDTYMEKWSKSPGILNKLKNLPKNKTLLSEARKAVKSEVDDIKEEIKNFETLIETIKEFRRLDEGIGGEF